MCPEERTRMCVKHPKIPRNSDPAFLRGVLQMQMQVSVTVDGSDITATIVSTCAGDPSVGLRFKLCERSRQMEMWDLASTSFWRKGGRVPHKEGGVQGQVEEGRLATDAGLRWSRICGVCGSIPGRTEDQLSSSTARPVCCTERSNFCQS
ncbi:hypothetical protein GN956_G3650 [Arapaima gigas]